MIRKLSDRAWQRWGAEDPYYAVAGNTRFQAGALDSTAKEEFFSVGEAQVAFCLDFARRTLDPKFAPRRALDFGCGTGRATAPMAKQVDSVVGVDVSEGMLAEARKNFDEMGLTGTFVPSDDELTRVEGEFDLIYSWVVFQHIHPSRGEALTEQLLSRLAPGGIAALHYTIARDMPWHRTALMNIRENVPFVHAAYNVVRGRELTRPKMEMYQYDTSQLLKLYMRHGAQNCAMSFSSHSGTLGVFVFVRRPLDANDPTALPVHPSAGAVSTARWS